ncbi:MAG: phosphomannomutase/phosphoglucomutase [Lachnospiraceae bacterium]|jgi:phosphomannomutase|nr:phosphomannomutase/phosphoglucomutase [Lachnospiraceae bacterium]
MENSEKYLKLQNGSDVRGIALTSENGEANLTAVEARTIAAAFTGWLSAKTGKPCADLRIGIGHDSRLTADSLSQAACEGACSKGAQVFLCGLVSTPSMFLSTVLKESSFDGSVMITASHMPSDRNGLKFFTKDGGLEKNEITEILKDAASSELAASLPAEGKPFDLLTAYCSHLKEIMKKEVGAADYEHPLKGLKIVEDAGNGAAGFFAPRILEALGADTEGSVFLDPDGKFPNHIPNPENPAAMEAIRKATVEAKADLGVIFDCDGDRAAVVLGNGEEANRNTLIALISAIIAEQHPKSTVVTDSVTSDELTEFLNGKLGLKHLRFKRGYKNVIDKGIELNAAGEDCELAIETSGHGALKENYFSDDGAYLCVKIICRMARLKAEGKKISDLIADLGQPAEAREIRFTIAGEGFRDYGLQVLKDFEAFAAADERFHIVTPNYEGVRVSFDDPEVKGWVLLRMSLHEPKMPMNLESKEKGGLDVILGRIRPFFEKYDRLSRL